MVTPQATSTLCRTGESGAFLASTMAHDLEQRSLKISTANRPTDRQALGGRPPSLPPGNLATTPGAWSSDWRDELHGSRKAASTATSAVRPRELPLAGNLIYLSHGYA